MQKTNNRRGFTQINWVGQALPDNAPAKGHLAAFTLIELLVVVLIIGILAAMAVPQYQLAIDKSRVTHLLSMVDAVKKAQEVYYLENGTYTANWNDLAIAFTGTIDGGNLTLENGQKLTLNLYVKNSGVNNEVTATDPLLPKVQIQNYYQKGPAQQQGKLTCYAHVNSTRAKRLCRSITHKTQRNLGSGSTSDGHDVYYFN